VQSGNIPENERDNGAIQVNCLTATNNNYLLNGVLRQVQIKKSSQQSRRQFIADVEKMEPQGRTPTGLAKVPLPVAPTAPAFLAGWPSWA